MCLCEWCAKRVEAMQQPIPAVAEAGNYEAPAERRSD